MTADLVEKLRRALQAPAEAPAPRGGREAGVLMLADPGVRGLPLLFVLRADHLRLHAGQIGFPGGSREPDDPDIVATALREATEEVGLDPADVEVLGTLPARLTARSNLWLTPVVALLRRPFSVRGDGYEVAEWFWLPLAELRLAPHTVRDLPTPAGEPRLVHYFEAGGRIIWGVTGGIIHDLLERLAPA